MPNATEIFRKNLERIFRSKVISKAELAKKAGLSEMGVRNYLRGASPTLESLERIADALGLSAVDLLIEPGEKSPSKPDFFVAFDVVREVIGELSRGNIPDSLDLKKLDRVHKKETKE